MKNHVLTSLVFISLFSCQQEETKDKYYFNEEFDTNTRGWVEEKAEPHTLMIKNGVYELDNRDPESGRSSAKFLDRSWLFALPEAYQIEASFKMSSADEDTASCGLVLEGNTFEYEFRVHDTGKPEISLYNYRTKETLFFDNVDNADLDEKIELAIVIQDWEFTFFVNDKEIANGELLTKSWTRIAPFTGPMTKTYVDYLRIKELTTEEN